MKKDDLYYQDFKDMADLFFCITENKILKERIEKAVEYISKHLRDDSEYPGYVYCDKVEKYDLLNILRGENNE